MNKKTPTFAETRRSFVANLYVIAYTLNLHIRPGGGSALLGLNELEEWPTPDKFDLDRLGFEDSLKVIYQYAYHAEIGDIRIEDDLEEGNLGRLISINNLIGHWLIDRNYEDISEMFGDVDLDYGIFPEMLSLAEARNHLDSYSTISIKDLTVLTGLTERSVRNAMHSEGIEILKGFESIDEVNKYHALKWLVKSKGFKETIRVGSEGSIPDAILAEDMPGFFKSRMQQLLRFRYMEYHAKHLESGESETDTYLMCENFGRKIGWSAEQVQALWNAQSIDEISPDDGPSIARMLGLDSVWLTHQIMKAKFPDAMRTIAPNQVGQMIKQSLFNEEANTLTAVLTEAGIRNGYIDIERRYADRFFPSDCFGTKGSERHGNAILLHSDLGNAPDSTDIRVKSKVYVSPRKRFHAFFKSHKAKAGDQVQFKRIGEREYELTFEPK